MSYERADSCVTIQGLWNLHLTNGLSRTEVCLDGVLHLLYLPDGRNDVFAVDDVAHFIRMITYATKPREVQERIKREQRTHLGEDLMD